MHAGRPQTHLEFPQVIFVEELEATGSKAASCSTRHSPFLNLEDPLTSHEGLCDHHSRTPNLFSVNAEIATLARLLTCLVMRPTVLSARGTGDVGDG